MAPIATWILLALVTAVVVMLVAGTTSGVPRAGVGQFVRDLRDGVRHRGQVGTPGFVRTTRRELAEAADAEGSVEDLFRIGQRPRSAYVDPVELAGPLVGATRRLRRAERAG